MKDFLFLLGCPLIFITGIILGMYFMKNRLFNLSQSEKDSEKAYLLSKMNDKVKDFMDDQNLP